MVQYMYDTHPGMHHLRNPGTRQPGRRSVRRLHRSGAVRGTQAGNQVRMRDQGGNDMSWKLYAGITVWVLIIAAAVCAAGYGA